MKARNPIVLKRGDHVVCATCQKTRVAEQVSIVLSTYGMEILCDDCAVGPIGRDERDWTEES